MKVVIDTNVFISGIFFDGAPYRVLQAWRDKHLELLITVEIFAEYQRVADIFAQEHPGIDLSKILEYLLNHAEIFIAAPMPEQVCVDADDDKFIACALASGSKIIISGDKHLLSVSGYHNIQVLKPSDFLIQYARTFEKQ